MVKVKEAMLALSLLLQQGLRCESHLLHYTNQATSRLKMTFHFCSQKSLQHASQLKGCNRLPARFNGHSIHTCVSLDYELACKLTD